jgi:hypothetical protein
MGNQGGFQSMKARPIPRSMEATCPIASTIRKEADRGFARLLGILVTKRLVSRRRNNENWSERQSQAEHHGLPVS